MNNAISKNFKDYYNSYSEERRMKCKVQLLNNHDLKINADRLEKDDLLPLLKALKCDKDLHSLIVYSRFFYKKMYSNNSRLKQNKTANEPIFLKATVLVNVIDALATCIINSDFLCTLYLEAIPLNDYHIKILNNSISNQMNLQNLALPYCNLNDENVISLCRTIRKHIGLQKIDLTGCGITYNGAKELSEVIRSQKLVRYGETWKQSLRYRLPQPDILPGLRRITLNDNISICDEGFKIICYELMDDLWIKAIDLQNCGITNSSTEDALELVETNPIIQILDIRRNDISINVIKMISDKLQSNTCDDNGEIYKWIATSQSSITSLSSYSTQHMSIMMPIRLKSWPNEKLIRNSTLSKIKSSNKSINSFSSSNTSDCKINSNNIISELQRTRSLLRKVTGNLVEERNKRIVIEKEHNKFKEQLDQIRTCLMQNYHNMNCKNNKKIMTNSPRSSASKILKCNNCINKKITKNQLVNFKTKNRNAQTLKIPKSTVSSYTDITTESFKSAKLLTYVPASNSNQNHKSITYKKISRSNSAVTKVTKMLHL